jgi:cytochrome c biogenesis protein CcmG/thiol:disulfide interchange protein DsbE
MRRGKLLLNVGIVCLVGALAGLLAWRLAANEEAKGVAAAAAADEQPEAPDFELSRLDGGGPLSLSSLRGQVVVLNFWASWCAPCREEAPVLEEAWQRYRDRGVVFVGVDSRDLSSDGREFVAEYGITYPNVHDGEGSTAGRFGVPALPETMFVGRDGRITGYIAGPVDAAGLEREIEEALAS